MSALQTHRTGLCGEDYTTELSKTQTSSALCRSCATLIKKDGLPSGTSSEQLVRYGCRDVFRQKRILAKLIPTIEEILSAGGIEPPGPAEDQILPAIPNPEVTGDDGHRN